MKIFDGPIKNYIKYTGFSHVKFIRKRFFVRNEDP
jgi:hypothetical protein